MQKFGKYIDLRIRDKARQIIFNSVSEAKNTSEEGSPYLDRLRVDFDMRLVPRHGRLKVDIYNLSDETIKTLVEGEDLTMEIWVGLHGEDPVILGHSMYVSNVLSFLKVPNNITSLYGFTELKRTVLETQMADTGFIKKGATFKEAINTCARLASKKAGEPKMAVTFKMFPDEIDTVTYTKQRTLKGSLEEMLDSLTKEVSSIYYIDDKGLNVVYIPSKPNTRESKPLDDSAGEIKISPANLRSNPKVSLGSIALDVNLEPDISPTDVIDTTDFITAEFNVDPFVLIYSNGVVTSAGPTPKMLALYVDHKGSTHTNSWNTSVVAYGPTVGNSAKVHARHWAD